MNDAPNFVPLELSRLRDIGWREWDPIGLLPAGASWQDHLEFADEYDRYLIHAATRLRRDWTVAAAADYFVRVIVDQMGLSGTPARRTAAEATARAIKACLDGRRSASGPIV